MNDVLPDILHRIGNTSLVALRTIAPENGSRILLKLEDGNPTGSMKDRMALAMIVAAEADGRLKPGRKRRRIHRRQHRRVAGSGLCGEGIPAAHRVVGRVRQGRSLTT